MIEIKGQYLTEKGLYEALQKIFNCDFIKDKSVPNSGINKRPDFRNDDLKLIVEFDGDLHYSVRKRQKVDIEKDSVYSKMGYKVVHIPYFVQLSSVVIKDLFGVEMEWEQVYPHGFIDSEAMLPVDFNYYGIYRFRQDLKKFSYINDDIIESLQAKIELLGSDDVLPYGMTLEELTAVIV